jgi:hypothetical protein
VVRVRGEELLNVALGTAGNWRANEGEPIPVTAATPFQVMSASKPPGNPGDTFGTAVSPTARQAVFVDEGDPPQMDEIERFGYARWGSMGENDCPLSVERRDATLGQIKSGYRR